MTKKADGWQERAELPDLLPPVPLLKSGLIPEGLQGWIVDLAERLQVPLEMVAAPAIAMVHYLINRSGLAIRPKQKDDWTVLESLWSIVIARSGLKKTPAQNAALKPLNRVIEEARKDYREAVARYDAGEKVRKTKLRSHERAIAKAPKSGDEKALTQHEQQVSELSSKPPPPKLARFQTNDPTVEKLGELLQDNPAMLLVRDELPGWLRSLERAGREGDREFYLEGWNGSSAYTSDRITRGTIEIPRLSVAIIGSTQPGKLQDYISEAVQGGWGDDGLLQRFQMAVYPDPPPGEFNYIDREPDEEAYQRAASIIELIAHLDPISLRAEGDHEQPFLHFDDHAQDFFESWLTQLEHRLRSGEIASPAFESHLAKYRSLMPRLALTFEVVDWADAVCARRAEKKGTPLWIPIRKISLQCAVAAACWCDVLEAHALRIYAGAINPGLQAAHALAAKIMAGKIRHGDTVRSAYRPGWSLLKDPAIVKLGLEILEKHNWIRVDHVSTGGRSREVIHLHPNLRNRSEGKK